MTTTSNQSGRREFQDFIDALPSQGFPFDRFEMGKGDH
jgi:hypothetical protein